MISGYNWCTCWCIGLVGVKRDKRWFLAFGSKHIIEFNGKFWTGEGFGVL